MQNKLLSSHEKRLQDLDNTIQAGHTAILSQIGSLDRLTVGSPQSASSSSTCVRDQRQRVHATQRSSRNVRLKLPNWFTKTVWEFGTYDFGDGWAFQVRPINIRSRTTPAFAAVRLGDVQVVKGYIASGELSASDYEYSHYTEHRSLLTVSGSHLGSQR